MNRTALAGIVEWQVVDGILVSPLRIDPQVHERGIKIDSDLLYSRGCVSSLLRSTPRLHTLLHACLILADQSCVRIYLVLCPDYLCHGTGPAYPDWLRHAPAAV